MAEQPRAPPAWCCQHRALAACFLGSSRTARVGELFYPSLFHPATPLLISILLISRSLYLHCSPTGACCLVPDCVGCWSLGARLERVTEGEIKKLACRELQPMLCISSAATDIFSAPTVPWPVPKSWDWAAGPSGALALCPCRVAGKGSLYPMGPLRTWLGLFQ